MTSPASVILGLYDVKKKNDLTQIEYFDNKTSKVLNRVAAADATDSTHK